MNEPFSPSTLQLLPLTAQMGEIAIPEIGFRGKVADIASGLGKISPSHLSAKPSYLNMAKVNILIMEMGTVGQPGEGTSRS